MSTVASLKTKRESIIILYLSTYYLLLIFLSSSFPFLHVFELYVESNFNATSHGKGDKIGKSKTVHYIYPTLYTSYISYTTTNKLHGLSPRTNYTDRATAACRRSDCQLLRIKCTTWSA
jgi:hypothetical protein